ncbi:MAG: hypothetical protein JW959_14145 [Pirellulales bacterium]|nr:hypothetical protein [Pirellulales bacterium]
MYLVEKAPVSDLCDEYGIRRNENNGWAPRKNSIPASRRQSSAARDRSFLAKDFKQFIYSRGMRQARQPVLSAEQRQASAIPRRH